MTTPVDTGVPGFGYGLGLTVLQAPLIPVPEGRLIGHDGGMPGFLNNVLSTEDGRRQLGSCPTSCSPRPACSRRTSRHG
jgi:hypothetical protein